MKRAVFWLATGLVLIAALWLGLRLFSGPERVIRARLAKLAREASFQPGEAPLAKISHVSNLRSFFAPGIVIRVNLEQGGTQTLEGREDLMEALAAVRGTLPGLELEFLDVQVEVNADRVSASAVLTLRYRLGREKEPALQELKLVLQKSEQGWQVNRVENVNALRR